MEIVVTFKAASISELRVNLLLALDSLYGKPQTKTEPGQDEKKTRAPRKKKPEVEAEASVPEPEATLEDAPLESGENEAEAEPEAPVLNRMVLVDKLQEVVKKRSIVVGREILKRLGVERVSQLSEDKFPEFNKLLDQALETEASI